MNLFADDTTLYDMGFDKDILEKKLQHALNLLNTGCLENGMIINIEKTKKCDVNIESTKEKQYDR